MLSYFVGRLFILPSRHIGSNVLIEQMGLNMLTEFYLLRVDGSCVELVVTHALPVTFYLTNHSEVV